MLSSKMIKFAFFATFIILQVAMLPAAASAQEAVENIMPPVDVLPAETAQERGMAYESDEHTHPSLKMTPDKSELVRLEGHAASIIIGNPNHLSILADSSQTLVLVPRAPGATHFTVLDKNGAVIMQRHVIVASPKEKYLRVRRSCAGTDDDSCRNTSVFYCPVMCHEILLGDGEADAESAGLAANADASNAQNSTAPDGQTPPPDGDTE